MYEAAAEQFAVVRRRAARLSDGLRAQLRALRRLRAERRRAVDARDGLRRALAAAERRAVDAAAAAEAAEAALRRTAAECSAAQLLQKRYANALAAIDGRHRAIVRVAGGEEEKRGKGGEEEEDDEEEEEEVGEKRGEKSGEEGGKSFVVTDACTVVEVQQRRSFVFDVAYTAPTDSLRSSSYVSDSPSLSPSTAHGMTDAELADAIEMDRVVSDALSGINTVFMTFGPAGGGKTEVLFGSNAAAVLRGRTQRSLPGAKRFSLKHPESGSTTGGIFAMFVEALFDSLSAQAVTHFNISCSFAELAVNQTVDLLRKPYGRSYTRQAATLRPLSADDPGAAASHMHPSSTATAANAQTKTMIGMSDALTCVPAETAEETMRILQEGVAHMRRWWRSGSARERANVFSSRSQSLAADDDMTSEHTHYEGYYDGGGIAHAVFSLTVESFNTKGHYRRAVVSFVDLCGPAAAGRAAGIEAQWIKESLRALCDAIAATCGSSSASQAHMNNSYNNNNNPNRTAKAKQQSEEAAKAAAASFDRLHSAHSNTLARFLRPVFGGNAKAVMVCCVDAERHTKEQILNSLSYAYYFKSVPHQAQPYDIPPELQRLNLQMNAFLSEEEEYDEEDENERKELNIIEYDSKGNAI